MKSKVYYVQLILLSLFIFSCADKGPSPKDVLGQYLDAKFEFEFEQNELKNIGKTKDIGKITTDINDGTSEEPNMTSYIDKPLKIYSQIQSFIYSILQSLPVQA